LTFNTNGGIIDSMEITMHTKEDCEIKCDAIKMVLTQIQQNAAMEDQYSIRHLAESGLDLIRDLKSEFK